MKRFLKLKTNFVVSIAVEKGPCVCQNLLSWWIEWTLLAVKNLPPCAFQQMSSNKVVYAACES